MMFVPDAISCTVPDMIMSSRAMHAIVRNASTFCFYTAAAMHTVLQLSRGTLTNICTHTHTYIYIYK